MACGCGQDLFCSCVFCVRQVQVPAFRGFEMRVSQLGQVAGEAFSFGFQGLLLQLAEELLQAAPNN